MVPSDTVPTGVNRTSNANITDVNADTAKNAAMLYLLQQQLQQQQTAAETSMYVYRPNVRTMNVTLSPPPQQQLQLQPPSQPNHDPTEIMLAVMTLLRIGFLSYLAHRARHRITLEEQGFRHTAAVL